MATFCYENEVFASLYLMTCPMYANIITSCNHCANYISAFALALATRTAFFIDDKMQFKY